MAKSKKITVTGNNVRLRTESHKKIKTFCTKRRLKIGGFVEDAAIEKMASIKSAEIDNEIEEALT